MTLKGGTKLSGTLTYGGVKASLWSHILKSIQKRDQPSFYPSEWSFTRKKRQYFTAGRGEGREISPNFSFLVDSRCWLQKISRLTMTEKSNACTFGERR